MSMEKKVKTSNYEVIIPENEEIRDGFKVSSNRKKVWNVQLGLLEELKKICKKHNLKYYADGGTLLGAIRHKGYIPWDDDMDFVMLREDYDKFLEIAPKELPSYIRLWEYHGGFSKLVNINTAALGDDNRWDKDYLGGIWIDIFPIDYASKFMIINQIKNIILLFIRMILDSQKCCGFIDRMKGWKGISLKISKIIFKKSDCSRLRRIYEKVTKKTIFKGKNVYNVYCTYVFFPENIYNKSSIVKFENTTVCIPNGYDTCLKIKYGNYMKPIIDTGGHHCRYSVEESYKDIIKSFDKSKTNEDNYNNCKSLFLL